MSIKWSLLWKYLEVLDLSKCKDCKFVLLTYICVYEYICNSQVHRHIHVTQNKLGMKTVVK